MAATAFFYASSDNAGQTSTDNLIRMFGRQLTNGFSGTDPNPAILGVNIGTEINSATEPEIWIYPNKLIEALHGVTAATAVGVGDFLINGPDIGLRLQRFQTLCENLYDTLDDKTIISGLYLDEESQLYDSSWSYYALGATAADRGTAMYNVLQHPQLRKYFPSYMWDLTEAQLQAFSSWDSTVGSRYAVDWDRVIIAKEIATARRFVDVFAGVFGYVPAMTSNYEDENLIRTRRYVSNQPLGSGTRTIAGTSSPAMWLTGDSQYVFAGLSKPNWWNMLIYDLNWCRSLRGPVVPQICLPGYDGDSNPFVTNYNLWDAMMAHLGAMGYDTFIGFTPGWTTPQKDHMQTVLGALDVATDAPTRYELIEYDADSITTNGVTTEYDAALGTGRVTS